MDGSSVNVIDYSNHINKCRICFKLFNNIENRVKISKNIENKFREVTQTDLNLSEEFSKEICVICSYQLTKYCRFRSNVILSQSNLLKFVFESAAQNKTSKKPNLELVAIKQEFVEFYENESEKKEVGISIQPELKVFEQPNCEFFNFCEEANFPQTSLENSNDLHKIKDPKTNAHQRASSKPYNLRLKQKSKLNLFVKSKSFACIQCEFKSVSKPSLNKHMLTHVELKKKPPNHQCDQCDFTSNSKSSLQLHCKQEHSTKDVTEMQVPEKAKSICKHCDKSFKGIWSIRNHIKVHYADNKSKFSCLLKGCTKVFLTLKDLRAHIALHGEYSKQVCSECGLLLSDKFNLQKHINRVHLKIKNFFCDLCSYSSMMRSSMANHMVTHMDPNERRKWNCEKCSFVTVSKPSLRVHIQTHSEIVNSCHCGKIFRGEMWLFELNRHIKTVHQKVHKHFCNLCGKGYYAQNVLKNHMKIRHMEKSLSCDICGKLFGIKRHLTGHMLYHKEPKFKCNFKGCTKAFVNVSRLKGHMKIHAGKRDHACHLCEKSYFHQKDLRLHWDVAHKAKTFHCELCTFTNSRKDYLQNHLNSAHKNLSLEQKKEILARVKVTRKNV